MKQLNFQSELHFDFRIAKLDDVPLFVQSVNLPSITTKAPQTGTPFAPISHQGDSLDFGNLVVTLKLDEGMTAWYELWKWLTGLTRPEKYQEFRDLINNNVVSLDGLTTIFNKKELKVDSKGYHNHKSTASLLILDSDHVPYLEYNFINLHPISISDLQFQSDATSTNYMNYAVTFVYDFAYPKMHL